MKRAAILILVAAAFTFGCGGIETDQPLVNDSCPERQEYFSKIETIKAFHAYEDTLLPHLRYDSLEWRFATALDSLYGWTGLGSHVCACYVFEYASQEDYENDIRQYTEWYEGHRPRTVREAFFRFAGEPEN